MAKARKRLEVMDRQLEKMRVYLKNNEAYWQAAMRLGSFQREQLIFRTGEFIRDTKTPRATARTMVTILHRYGEFEELEEKRKALNKAIHTLHAI
ncbi:MAG: hypothetical protein AABX02_02300 [archaeon]